MKISNDKYRHLKEELERTQREQITDIYATFNTRIGRYTKIKLLKHLLNNVFIPENTTQSKV